MKILTISASPYLLTRLGRMNAALLPYLQAKGNEVVSAVWHLDKSYYMAETDGKFYFDQSDKRICELFPVNKDDPNFLNAVCSVIKSFKPDVILTIGDCDETIFIHSIKASYPTLFRWVAIFTTGGLPLDASMKDAIESIDECIVTTEDGLKAIRSLSSVPVSKCNPGVDGSVFYREGNIEREHLTVAANLKNAQSSNIASYLSAITHFKSSDVKVRFKLHTNINDSGDYDIPKLVRQLGIEGLIELPRKFCSVQVGPDDSYLRDFYSNSDVIVDPSMESSTAMSVLEAMSCGCVPLVTKTGALREIQRIFSKPQRIGIESFPFIGQKHRLMEVASDISIAIHIRNLAIEYKGRRSLDLRKDSLEIAQRYSRSAFVIDVENAIGRSVGGKQLLLAVDELA